MTITPIGHVLTGQRRGRRRRTCENFSEMSEESNTSIVMVNGIEDIAVMFAPRGEFMEQQMQRYLLGQAGKGYEKTIRKTENYSIEKRYDRISNNYYLECWGFFSDNVTAFLMSMPVAGIQDSVRLSSRFLLYVGMWSCSRKYSCWL